MSGVAKRRVDGEERRPHEDEARACRLARAGGERTPAPCHEPRARPPPSRAASTPRVIDEDPRGDARGATRTGAAGVPAFSGRRPSQRDKRAGPSPRARPCAAPGPPHACATGTPATQRAPRRGGARPRRPRPPPSARAQSRRGSACRRRRRARRAPGSRCVRLKASWAGTPRVEICASRCPSAAPRRGARRGARPRRCCGRAARRRSPGSRSVEPWTVAGRSRYSQPRMSMPPARPAKAPRSPSPGRSCGRR